MASYGSGQTLHDHNFTSGYATELVELSFFRSQCQDFKYITTSKHPMTNKRAHWWGRATYEQWYFHQLCKNAKILCEGIFCSESYYFPRHNIDYYFVLHTNTRTVWTVCYTYTARILWLHGYGETL